MIDNTPISSHNYNSTPCELIGINSNQVENSINKVIVQTLNNGLTNSISPSIAETERFILFLSHKFNIPIKDELLVNIQTTSPSKMGFFMPSNSPTAYQKDALNPSNSEKQTLNLICLSSLYLKTGIYETIAHEFAHFVNNQNGHKDKNNYHSKHFKIVAEKLLLSVKKGNHGYNITEETPEFKNMLIEFMPNENAFKIFQNFNEKEKKGSRNLLFMCSCGCKVRSAKNEDKPLNAVCSYCLTKFEVCD